MASIKILREYTLDRLLEEATMRVEKEKKRIYCNILVAYPGVFDDLSLILELYGKRARSHWIVNMYTCAEEDFYLVRFVPKDEFKADKPLVFFWKIIRDEKYVTILSFSFHRHVEVHRSLDSLVKFVKGLWFAWIGSHFLENFDLFAQRIWGEDTKVFASFQTAVEKGKTHPRKMRVYPLPPRGFVPLEEIRRAAKEDYFRYGKILTFSSMRYRIISEEFGGQFTFSMSARAKIMFEAGDFTVFSSMLKSLFQEARSILNFLRRKVYSTEQESTLFGKNVKIRSLDLIETLVFKKSKEAKEWHSKVKTLFQSDILEEKLVNFTLLSGNPHFLVHVVDVENSSSVYLSATRDEIQITPAEKYVNEGTIAKILELLESKIDPSISIWK